MRVDVEGDGVGELVDRLLECGILERLDRAAAPADEMVVVLAAGVARLVARDTVAHLDAVDEPELVELLERAVDARQADGAIERVFDVARADGAVLAAERVEHGAAGAAAPVTGLLQARLGLFGPTVGVGAHAVRWYVAIRAATNTATSTATIDAPAAVSA